MKIRCEAYVVETLDSAWLDGSGSVVGIGGEPFAIDCLSRSNGSGGSAAVVAAMVAELDVV